MDEAIVGSAWRTDLLRPSNCQRHSCSEVIERRFGSWERHAVITGDNDQRVVQFAGVFEDGQRVFIGGLLRNKESRNRLGVPYLMDVPVLGWAFRTDETIYSTFETVVLLTAHLVDDEPPQIAVGEERRLRESERFLETQRLRMEDYFGPAAPAPGHEALENAPAKPESAAGASP